jgi:hypothetical protein
LLGGQWLTTADRDRVAWPARRQEKPVFARAVFQGRVQPRHIRLGRTAIAERRRARRDRGGAGGRGLVCWSAGGGSEERWPATAVDADNRPGSAYACSRIAYSIRGDTPTWRAFIEQREPA